MDNNSVVYFVSWYLHNKTNNGWAYKVENRYNTPDAAYKAFYTLLGNYIGGDTYDIIICILSDSNGSTEVKRYPEINNDVIVDNNPPTE